MYIVKMRQIPKGRCDKSRMDIGKMRQMPNGHRENCDKYRKVLRQMPNEYRKIATNNECDCDKCRMTRVFPRADRLKIIESLVTFRYNNVFFICLGGRFYE